MSLVQKQQNRNYVASLNNALQLGVLLSAEPNKKYVTEVWYLERFWRVIKCIFVGRERAFGDCKLERVVERLEKVYKGIDKTLDYKHRRIFLHVLKVLNVKVRKTQSKKKVREITQRVFDRYIIEYKKELVSCSLDHMKDHKRNPSVAEAYNFLEQAQAQLEEGKNAPLPFWFHATPAEAAAKSIFQDGIQQNSAPRGLGAYVSSNWEKSFGNFVFALDLSTMPFLEGKWLDNQIDKPYSDIPSPCKGNINKKIRAVWARIEEKEGIPIKDENLAFFITSAPSLFSGQRCRKVRFTTYNAIRTAFERVISDNPELKRTVPFLWSGAGMFDGYYGATPLPEEFDLDFVK